MPLKEDEPRVPEGFLFSTARAEIKYTGRNDLGLIFCPEGAVVAGVFTKNRVKAAPVVDAIKRLRTSGNISAVLVNSGCANACTGNRGMEDLKKTTRYLATRLNLKPGAVLMSSTGVIGQRLPVKKVLKGIDGLIKNIGEATALDFARAIMTTDTFPKVAFRQIRLSGCREGTILGIAKGAGMINPSMATMLAFVLTDIAIERKTMKQVLADAVARTFNCITVDNDMSTNDTVLLISSAKAGNTPLREDSLGFRRFRQALYEVLDALARMIVKDGEGATKSIEVIVKSARTEKEAKDAAKAVAGSLLVKTAIHGADPNWGRIMAVIGSSGIRFREERVSIRINGVKVVERGVSTGREERAREKMQDSEMVVIEIDLKEGNGEGRALGCDLTEDYVRLNAHYTT